MKAFRKNLLFMFSIILVSILVVGCGGGEEGSSTESKTDTGEKTATDVEQEVKFGTITEALGLSPSESWDGASAIVIKQMYETLIERDPETGEIIPLLATSYETPDDTTWIFNLREGVEFHDGSPFNAEAVKYSFEKLVDPETAAPAAHLLEFMDKIEVVDEYTVKLTTNTPSPNTLPILATESTSIISPEADQNQNLMQEPIGTGPFKFESWTQGDRIIMVKNDEYWGEPATIEKLTYITVPDPSTAVSMLEAGEVDIISGTDPALLPRIE